MVHFEVYDLVSHPNLVELLELDPERLFTMMARIAGLVARYWLELPTRAYLMMLSDFQLSV